LFVVLLTNRTYAPRSRRPATVIANVRNEVADAAAYAIVGERSSSQALQRQDLAGR
jgi:hypothetical protein